VGIHVLEQRAMREKTLETVAPPQGAFPGAPRKAQLARRVFGYHRAGFDYSTYQFGLLSTVGYFSYEVDSQTGGAVSTHGWPNPAFNSLAHNGGAKVVLVVTSFGYAANDALLGDPSRTDALIANLISLVQGQGDGVNIDFEQVNTAQRQNLVSFIAKLSDRFHQAIPGSEVSIAIPAVDWRKSFDVTALAASADYLVMMGYDYHYSGDSVSGPVAPLAGESLNLTASLDTYLGLGVPPSKLLLGVPYYGYDWPTVAGTAKAATRGTGVAVRYKDAIVAAARYGRIWDVASKTPWYLYQASDGWHQAWYDDAESLTAKYDAVNRRGLGGVAIWALGYDGTNPELWDLLATWFSAAGVPSISGVTESAGFGQTISPGTLFTIFGQNFSNATTGAPRLPLPAGLGGAAVSVNGIPAPLLWVSPAQINAQAPIEIKAGSANVQVQTVGGTAISLQPALVTDAAPGIFSLSGTGIGPGVIAHADFSIVSKASPAKPGEVVILYATGLGKTNPAIAAGKAGNGEPTVLTPTVSIGGQPASVLFSGSAPGFAGLYQLNVQVPNVPAGDQPVLLTIGEKTSQKGCTLAVGTLASQPSPAR
jgi:uncharacterized protein (TIGR03437 family)